MFLFEKQTQNSRNWEKNYIFKTYRKTNRKSKDSQQRKEKGKLLKEREKRKKPKKWKERIAKLN